MKGNLRAAPRRREPVTNRLCTARALLAAATDHVLEQDPQHERQPLEGAAGGGAQVGDGQPPAAARKSDRPLARRGL